MTKTPQFMSWSYCLSDKFVETNLLVGIGMSVVVFPMPTLI